MSVWAWTLLWVNTCDIRFWRMNITGSRPTRGGGHGIHRPEDRCRPGPGGKLRWGATKQWLEKSTKMVINEPFPIFWGITINLF